MNKIIFLKSSDHVEIGNISMCPLFTVSVDELQAGVSQSSN